MRFSTYLMKESDDVNIAKEYLIGELETYETEDEKKREIVNKIKEIIMNGNRTTYASRYGLEEANFADTELINAYQRRENSVDYLIYRYYFKNNTMKKELAEYPMVLAIEASGLCNLKCNMCFQNTEAFQKDMSNKGIMSYELFERIMDEIEGKGVYSIVIASRGEPLLNPDIGRMVALAKKKGIIDVKLNTNALLLTEERSHQLIKAGLDQIVFSIDSVVEEHYKQIRGSNLAVAIENIKRFEDIRKSYYPDSIIRLRVSMVINNCYSDIEEEEINKAKECWQGIVDELGVKTENDFKGIYSKDLSEDCQCCALLWERLYIWNDGTVNPCDIDFMSTLALGKLENDVTIKSLWQGREMQSMRRQHSEARGKMENVCKGCVGY